MFDACMWHLPAQLEAEAEAAEGSGDEAETSALDESKTAEGEGDNSLASAPSHTYLLFLLSFTFFQ